MLNKKISTLAGSLIIVLFSLIMLFICGINEKIVYDNYIPTETDQIFIEDSEGFHFNIDAKEDVGITLNIGDRFDFLIYSHLEYGSFDVEEKTFTGRITYSIKSGKQHIYSGVIEDVLINVDASSADILVITPMREIIKEDYPFSQLASSTRLEIPGPRGLRVVGEVYDIDDYNIFVAAERIEVTSQ